MKQFSDEMVGKQIQRFSHVFVVDFVLRCLSIGPFRRGEEFFILMLQMGPLYFVLILAALLFFIYVLIQMYKTVEILYIRKLFRLAPGWVVAIQAVLGHGLFGFILPVLVAIQAQQILGSMGQPFEGRRGPDGEKGK